LWRFLPKTVFFQRNPKTPYRSEHESYHSEHHRLKIWLFLKRVLILHYKIKTSPPLFLNYPKSDKRLVEYFQSIGEQVFFKIKIIKNKCSNIGYTY
jgi:hypothetical protein